MGTPRKQTATAEGGPFLTVEQLGRRWGKAPKTIANLMARGLLDLRPIRLYPGADPLLHVADVERLEQRAIRDAGIQSTEAA